MIVSKVKLDFSDISWANAGSAASERMKRVFDRVTASDEAKPQKVVEGMKLGELLYFVLLGEGAKV